MNKELLKNIQSINTSLAPYARAFYKSMEGLQPIFQAYAKEAEKIRRSFEPIAKSLAESATHLAIQAKKWQEKQKITVIEMTENGWFPNWFTFLYYYDQDNDSLDDFMISHLDDNWEEIEKKIIDFCPNRSHILKVAFDLHKIGNYIACIPLIMSQSDGICNEEFSYFFSKNNNTGKKASDEIIEKADSGEIVTNLFTELLLEPFKVDLHISKASTKASRHKTKGPNRHGIIHGSRKHLDYGTKINSYKALSFLAFIVYTTKDEFKKHQ